LKVRFVKDESVVCMLVKNTNMGVVALPLHETQNELFRYIGNLVNPSPMISSTSSMLTAVSFGLFLFGLGNMAYGA
jgi:hypothetical protein